jgi:cysteinyl-tRNA synthetase
MMAGARVEVNDKKKDPMDFVLWKAAKPGEPSWDSPWGKGRPGWHIECSAMSLRYLQPGFDFHGGGTDLVFPHHENEIAQSEAFSGKEPFVRYWLHSAFINIGNDKMSKSLGNFVTIREACEKFTAKAVRFWILGTHYRNPLSFGEEELKAAARGLERLENARQNWQHLLTADGMAGKSIDQAVSTGPKEGPDEKERAAEADQIKDLAEKAKKRFVEAMEDDFNTALALGVLYELVRDVNKWCLAEDFTLTPVEKPVLSTAFSVLNHYGEVLGIWFDEAREGAISDQEVADLVAERQKARAERDFQKADQIRERLKGLGIVLEDTPQGVRWKRG